MRYRARLRTGHFARDSALKGAVKRVVGSRGPFHYRLARANPFAVVPAAILWHSMLAGAPLMQQETGLSIDIVRIVQALVLLFVAADVIVRTVFRMRTKTEGGFEEPKFGTEWGGSTA